MHFARLRRKTPFAILVALLLFLSSASLAAQAPTAADGNSLAALNKLIRWKVVFEKKDGIYIASSTDSAPKLLAESGRYARWSPDGKDAAFLRGNQVVVAVSEHGFLGDAATTPKQILFKVIAEATEKPNALAYHPNGREVLFVAKQTLFAVDKETKTVRTLLSGFDFREIDVAAPGRWLISTVKIRGHNSILGFDLEQQKSWKVSGGCSASLSPDGRLATNNASSHKQLFLRKFDTGERAALIDAPPERTFDNQYWSNAQDWIASRTDRAKGGDIFVHQISTNHAFQLTAGGGADRPDFFVLSK